VERAAESAGSVFGEGKWRWVKAGRGAAEREELLQVWVSPGVAGGC
jgi:hypothetical protein